MTAEQPSVFGQYVVGYVDVLGQGEAPKQWAALPEANRPSEAFLNAARSTAEVVLGYLKSFREHFALLEKCSQPDRVAALPPGLQSTYWRCKNCNVTTERLSDSFAMYSPLRNRDDDKSISAVHQMIGACGLITLGSLAVGKPIRGGVSVGHGAILSDARFYGPALAEAHYMEEERAQWPRILISDNIKNLLTSPLPYSTDRRCEDVFRALAADACKLICRDSDGETTIDILGPGFRDLLELAPLLSDTVRAAKVFVWAQAAKHKANNCDKLAKRYDTLKQYFRSRFHLWDLSEES